MPPRMTRAEALSTIRNRRGQIEQILDQEISPAQLGRRLTRELEHWVFAAFFNDVELNMMSEEFLIELAAHGWWSRAGRLKLRKLRSA